MVALF